MVNKIPYCSGMIFNFFGKRESSSDQSGNSLSHCVAEPFSITCFSASLSCSTVPFGRKNLFIRGPEIRITDSTLPVNAGQRIPQPLSAFTVSAAGIYPGNLFHINIFCRPNQYFTAFVPDKRPHFVSFDGQAAFRHVSHFHFFRNLLIFFIYIILKPAFRNACNSYYSGRRKFFIKKSPNQIYGFLRYSFFSGFSTNCLPQSLHANLCFPLCILPYFMIFSP